jgi:NAD(P)-dependent dehydrogenase (short-subunit alcohol dehydrogenase family)
MQPRLAGKAALITGAGSRIGKSSAFLFGEHGAAVACADINRDTAEATAAAPQARGVQARAICADVRRGEDAQRMVAVGFRGKVHELDESDWDLIVDTSLKSVYLCSKAALSVFFQRGGGVNVNTASGAGLKAAPAWAAHCAAKAGVVMLTRQMALDYGPAVA